MHFEKGKLNPSIDMGLIHKKREEVVKEKKGEPEIKELKEKKKIKVPNIPVAGVLGSVKEFFSKVWLKIKPVLQKVKSFLKKLFGGIFEKLQERLGKERWFKKLSAKFSQNMPKLKGRRRVPTKGFKVDGYKTRDLRSKRFRIVGVGVVVITLLAFGINFTLKSKAAREIHYAADTLLTESESLLTKVESNLSTNKNSAETYIYQIGQKLESLPEGMNEEDSSRADEVRSQVLGFEDTLYKRVGITEDDGSITTFLDARLSFGDGSVPTDIEIYQDDTGSEYLLVTDSGNEGVYRVSLYDKEVKKLPDNESIMSSPQYLSIGNSGVFVFDDKEGVLKASFEDGWFGSFTSLSGLDIEDIRGENISEFIILTEVDNVYLLSQEKSSLLKSGFSYGTSYNLTYSYINNESFVNATDIIADLSLYVLDGNLIRYVYDYLQQAQVEAPLTVSGYSGDLGSLEIRGIQGRI